jgi:hypothetical protein
MPDGRRVICGVWDGRLGRLDVLESRFIDFFADHGAAIRDVRASRDGRLILSAGSGSLQIWDIASKAPAYQGSGVASPWPPRVSAYQLKDTGGGILCGIFLPGDREVLVGCFDTTVRRLRLPASLGRPKAD